MPDPAVAHAPRDRHGGFWYAFFAIFPWNLLGKSLSDLGAASATEQSPGIAWSQRYSYCVNWQSEERPPATPDVYKDYSCVISIGDILEIWAVEVFVYFVFAIYLDNILKNENGLRRPPWYFLMPGGTQCSPPSSSPTGGQLRLRMTEGAAIAACSINMRHSRVMAAAIRLAAVRLWCVGVMLCVRSWPMPLVRRMEGANRSS